MTLNTLSRHRPALSLLVAVSTMLPMGIGAQEPTGARAPTILRGLVTSDGRAVSGASVEIPASRKLVRTDTAGRFRLPVSGDSVQLVVRALGHSRVIRTVSLRGALTEPVSITLTRTAALLNAVVTTATMKERYLSDSPVKVELVTPALLERNASPNVMDNVSFLPGLTQQVDCGVCFTNNIRINGMEGPYTAVLIDGAPMMSALATVYGLNSIDPTLVEQIEIIRGPNSTLYGAEAMGGVINIVTKDPRLAPRMSVSASGTSNGETNLAIAAAPRFGGGRALVSLSGGHNSYFVDRNRDGFSDLPLVSRLSLMTKWTTGTPARRPFELMARVYGEDRFGGTADWMRKDRGSSTVYGESIRTWRAELLGTVRGGTMTSPFRLDVSGNLHHQNSVYGATPYLATQRTAFAQGVWSPRVGRHDVTAGATLRLQQYADSTRAQQVDETRFIPGVFVQDEVTVGTKLTVLGGMRADHHAAHGVIASPRLAIKWTPDPHTTVRLNAATGFRVVSLFTEDHAALTGARDVRIDEALRPERSATMTVSLARVFDVGGIEDALSLDADLFHTTFRNRIVGDFDVDPSLIVYRNLRGRAVTRGVSVAAGYATLRKPLAANVGLTLQDVSIDRDGVRRALPFAARVQGVFSLAYRFDAIRTTVDWTARVQGPVALPAFEGLADRSPWFTEQHLQFTHRPRDGTDLYVAVKNLFDFVQRDAIIDPFNPFGDRFDTARVYGPLQGRRLMVGIRQLVPR